MLRVGVQYIETLPCRHRGEGHSRRRHLDLAMEITAYDRPSLLGSTTTMPGAVVHGTVSFRPEGSGTRLAWDWDLRPTGAVRLLGPVVGWVGRRQEARLWASLRSHLEGQQ